MDARAGHRMTTIIVVTALLMLGCAGVAYAARPAAATGSRVIVTLSPDANPAAVRASMARLGIVPLKDLSTAGAIVAHVPSALAKGMLASNAGVVSVEPDYVVSVSAKPVTSKQSLPWGVDRIDADLAWPISRGSAVKVGVIDTGIDLTHPDLAANIAGSYSAVSYTTSADDDYGHGTHVAGTIAAVDNLAGVVGVAPSASLYALKALDYSGSGYTSDIVECIDWAIATDLDVINMSLGSPYYSSTFQAAVTRAYDAGIVVVASAGNSGPGENTVSYPGAYAGVIAVSATDNRDSLASFSSRGPQVDLAAPGVSIYSTGWNLRRGGIYTTMSGTSMAAPHVAGAAALVLGTPVGVNDADLDGVWDPAEVEARLTATAEDRGAAGFDNWYGFGIVDAQAALQ